MSQKIRKKKKQNKTGERWLRMPLYDKLILTMCLFIEHIEYKRLPNDFPLKHKT